MTNLEPWSVGEEATRLKSHTNKFRSAESIEVKFGLTYKGLLVRFATVLLPIQVHDSHGGESHVGSSRIEDSEGS